MRRRKLLARDPVRVMTISPPPISAQLMLVLLSHKLDAVHRKEGQLARQRLHGLLQLAVHLELLGGVGGGGGGVGRELLVRVHRLLLAHVSEARGVSPRQRLHRILK